MTGQISDIYIYQMKEYSIVALTSPVLFEPRDYGLEPHCVSTACHRGYWCEYAVTGGELVLKNLYLSNMMGEYPPINGTEVSQQEYVESIVYTGRRKKKKISLPAHHGHRLYKNVNLPISYTGKILLGRDFLNEYYIHMGFQRGWAYRELIELVFEEGLLMECSDLSDKAEEQRKAMKIRNDEAPPPFGADTARFIEDSFSLDYQVKTRWIEKLKKSRMAE